MLRPKNNYAFIDSQNLNLNIRSLGWILDFRKFRVYLREKYGAQKAYLFIGYIPENQRMYDMLAHFGYDLIFKPTIIHKDGMTKGNCDGELILQAMIDYQKYGQAILVSGDGDFHCLAKHLAFHGKLKKIIIPNRFAYSALLKDFWPQLSFMNDLRNKLAYDKEKTP